MVAAVCQGQYRADPGDEALTEAHSQAGKPIPLPLASLAMLSYIVVMD